MIPEYRFPLKRKCGFLHIGTPVSNLRNWGVKPPGILKIKNNNKEDDPDKGIDFQNYVVYGEDFQLQISAQLYAVANPDMESGQMSFRLRPETEMEFYLPFYFSPSRKIESLQIEEVLNSKLYLPISLYPEQRQIVLEN